MSICPCLQNFISKFTNRKNSKAYNPKQVEQESFICPSEQPTLSDTIKPIPKTKSIPQQKTHKHTSKLPVYREEEELPVPKVEDDLLDMRIQLQLGNPQPQSQPSHESVPPRDIQDLIEEELSLTPIQTIQTVQIKPDFRQDVPESEPQDIRQESFAINLDPLDPYFPIIHQKTANIQQYFNKTGQILDLPAPNKTDLQITQIDNPNMSTFLFKYKIKCEYSYYHSLIKNDKLHHLFSSLIAQVKVLESFRPNLTRNTLKFKRLASFEARECHYIKYHNSSKGQHWEVYINDDKAQFNPNYKSCDIFCLKNIRQIAPKQLAITEYLQVDLQLMNQITVLPKLANELKTYLNNMQSHIEKNYEIELV